MLASVWHGKDLGIRFRNCGSIAELVAFSEVCFTHYISSSYVLLRFHFICEHLDSLLSQVPIAYFQCNCDRQLQHLD